MVGGAGLEPASARLPAEDSVIELTAGSGERDSNPRLRASKAREQSATPSPEKMVGTGGLEPPLACLRDTLEFRFHTSR